MTFLVLVAALMMPTASAASPQDSPVSSAGVSGTQAEPAVSASVDPASRFDPVEPPVVFPVSLDRIRKLIGRPATVEQVLARRPTFKIEVEEEHHIQQLLSNLEFKDSKPIVPFGGSYNYEINRVMMASLGKPMMQPYAAFSGGELLTLAIEGLIAKYLGMRAVDAISAADRARAESAAKAEVARAIQDYCSGLPEKGAAVRLCTESPAH
jgi:hypothetical protein